MENIVNGFDFGNLPISIQYCGKIIEGKGGWDHFLYSVSIGTGENMFTTQYKCGLGHVEKKTSFTALEPKNCSKNSIYYKQWEEQAYKPKYPKNSDIMFSLLMESEASYYSFSDWCDNFGYDSDSIKALNIYQACENTGKQLNKVFSREQIEQMRKALEDY